MEGITFFREENLMNKSKKIISFIAALAMVVSMLIPNVSPVLADELSDQTRSVVTTESLGSSSVSTYSSYESSGWFENTYKAPERSYDGNNIGITITAHNSVPTHINTTFTVTLYRKNFIGSSKVGSVTFSRSCSGETHTFTNVGSGKYYFVFSKAGDGTREYLDYVHYYSY